MAVPSGPRRWSWWVPLWVWRAPRGQQSWWSHRNRQKRTQLELGTQLRRASRLESSMRTGVILRGKESPCRAPLRLRNIGEPWAADCDNLCTRLPIAKPESTDRPEISGLSSRFSFSITSGLLFTRSVPNLHCCAGDRLEWTVALLSFGLPVVGTYVVVRSTTVSLQRRFSHTLPVCVS